MKQYVKLAIDQVVRISIDQGCSIDDLVVALRDSYAAETARREHQLRHPPVGSFVVYFDPKLGQLTAHVLEVQEGGKIKLRVHRTAQPNLERHDVPYSPTPQRDHWSHRT